MFQLLSGSSDNQASPSISVFPQILLNFFLWFSFLPPALSPFYVTAFVTDQPSRRSQVYIPNLLTDEMVIEQSCQWNRQIPLGALLAYKPRPDLTFKTVFIIVLKK
jgi:hypothetical protein